MQVKSPLVEDLLDMLAFGGTCVDMRARFIAPWKDSTAKPVIYHGVSRVVDRRLAFGKEDKEQLGGNAAAAAGVLLSVRDLQNRIG
jgi:hypothetical protein